MGVPFIKLLTDLPEMRVLDADPAFLHVCGDDPVSTALLAYVTADGTYAVLAFDWEHELYFRLQIPPENLAGWERYGLRQNSFHAVDNADGHPRGIVITFPSVTYEIDGGYGMSIMAKNVVAKSALDAMLTVISEHADRFPGVRRGR